MVNDDKIAIWNDKRHLEEASGDTVFNVMEL